MAKPERGGMPQEEASEEKTLNPIERVRRAKPLISTEERIRRVKEMTERLDDVRETGKNLGIAVNLAGKLEALTQFVEKHSEEPLAERIAGEFETLEKLMRGKSPEEFFEPRVVDWVNTTFDKIQKIDGESKEK